MDQLRTIGEFLALAALHHQQVLLRGDVDILRTETGHREGDAVIVFTAARDVERGIIVAGVEARLVFEQVEQAVKTHGAAAIGSEIET